MKANPDYKWHNPDKVSPNQKMGSPKPGSLKALRPEMDLLSEGSIMPGKLAGNGFVAEVWLLNNSFAL